MRRLSLLASWGITIGLGGVLSACDSAGTGGVYGTYTGATGGGAGKAGAAGQAGAAGSAGGAAGLAGAAGKTSNGGTGGLSGGGQGGAAGAAGEGPQAGAGGASGGVGGQGGSGGSEPTCEQGAIVCEGTTQKICDGKGGFATTACPKACLDGLGCVECQPGTGVCNGTTGTQCRSDGSGYDQNDCDPELGLACTDGLGTCVGACAKQSLQRSYIGCEYFPTVTSNAGLYAGFHFAIAVGNTTSQEAKVTVKRGDTVVATDTVPPNSLKTIQLPWIDSLKGAMDGTFSSTLQAQGAYHVKTTQPVTVYQFNPLEFEIPNPGDCPDQAMTGKCNSFTNDASLLLPINALGTDYLVASAPTFVIGQGSFGGNTYNQTPGFVAITATDDATAVTVTSKSGVRPGTGIAAIDAGGTKTFTLNKGDVLQLLSADVPTAQLNQCQSDANNYLYCHTPAAYDLSGSSISATKPIMVVGGHDCTFMPYNAFACDHIEESMFPTNTLGTEVIVTAPQSVSGAGSNDGKPDKHTIRVISAVDGNSISLDPPIAPGGTLNKGQYADLQLTDKDVLIKGTGGLLVAQYMLGGDYVDPGAGAGNSKGDPSLSLGIPSAQYRKSYTFLAPDTYTYNFVNIVAKQGDVVQLDGASITISANPIGSSGYAVVRQKVTGGAHSITGENPFGIVVYGYGAYTSYMYPGGLNLSKL
jgi:hypothetical protein